MLLYSCTASNPPSLLRELQQYRTLCAGAQKVTTLCRVINLWFQVAVEEGQQ